MPKKPELPQSRRHLMIFDEDWEFLNQEYGEGSENKHVGVGYAIKQIIHAKVLHLKALATQRYDAIRAEQQKRQAAGSDVYISGDEERNGK